MKPIAFLVMPFGRKPTGVEAPAEVDFDALYERVYVPVLEELGYLPVRADQDVGGIIVTEMIERLAFSDLVVADISIPNANVYYELGVRHAALPTGCVVTSASWSGPLFDLQQVPRGIFPLPEGTITEATAHAARAALLQAIPALLDGSSPVHEALDGRQDEGDRVERFRAEARTLHDLSARIRAAHHDLKAAAALRDELISQPVLTRGLWLLMLPLIRDVIGWADALAWIDLMPENIRQTGFVEEQRALALAKSDTPEDMLAAIGALEDIIARRGASSERYGLLGGRYKRLYRLDHEGRGTVWLDRAIDAYERGMRADLNDYYPSSNLPTLYLARGGRRDPVKRLRAIAVAEEGARRSLALNPADPWVRPTLVQLALDHGDLEGAEDLLEDAGRELGDLAFWQLDTTLDDLNARQATADDEARATLTRLIAGFTALRG